MLRHISSRFWQFLCEELSFYTAKGFYYSYAWSCSLCEGRMSFCTGLSLENSTDSYLCFQLALLHSVSYFFSSIDQLLRLYTQILMPFHLIQTRFSRSAHLLMSYLIDLTTMVNFPNRIPDCDSHSPVLLDFFILLTLVFVLQSFPSIGKPWSCCLSFHWFSSNSKQDAPTGCPVLSYSLWLFSCWVHGLCDHLRDVPWEDIFRDIFVIIWVMLHGRISLSWELLLMQVNFVSSGQKWCIYSYANKNKRVHHFPETWLLGLLVHC